MKTFTFTTLSLFTLASAQFNLNTSGPNWDYTAKDLANTTSEACKAAYSANIDCNPTLVGLVASMEPGFKPGPSDFEATCTSSCTDALASYVANVKAACTAPGDKAQESVGGGDNVDMYLDPVETVGEIFQYTLQSDCATSSNGSYCYFQDVPAADSFSCDDECAIQFYQTAHDSAVADKQFNYYWLISRGDWWASEFATGWDRLVSCGKAVGGGNSSSSESASTGASPGITVIGEEPTKTLTAAKATGTLAASESGSTSTSGSKSTGTALPTATGASNSGHSLREEGVTLALLTFVLAALFV